MKKVIVVSYSFILFLMECLLHYDEESLCSCKVFSKQTSFRKHFILSFYWLCESRLWTEIKRRNEGKWVSLQQTNLHENKNKYIYKIKVVSDSFRFNCWSVCSSITENIFAVRHSLVRRQIKNFFKEALYFKGPRKAVVGYKIAPNRLKTTHRPVLTFEEKNCLLLTCLKPFQGFD